MNKTQYLISYLLQKSKDIPDAKGLIYNVDDINKLCKALECALDALNYIGHSPTRDCKEPARQALEQIDQIVSSEGS